MKMRFSFESIAVQCSFIALSSSPHHRQRMPCSLCSTELNERRGMSVHTHSGVCFACDLADFMAATQVENQEMSIFIIFAFFSLSPSRLHDIFVFGSRSIRYHLCSFRETSLSLVSTLTSHRNEAEHASALSPLFIRKFSIQVKLEITASNKLLN